MWEREVGAMARDQAKDDLPLVEITTPKGVLSIELFEDQAPNTVASFLEHAEGGRYAGTPFHRVLRGFGVQGGDPSAVDGGSAGRGSGGWTIADEGGREDRRAPLAGRLVAAKQRPVPIATEPIPNSAGSQFMILLAPAESLDRTYTVFGRVVDGLDVARRLRADDAILSAQVLRKRDRAYVAVRNETSSDGMGPTGDYSLPEPPPPPTPFRAPRPAPQAATASPGRLPVPVPAPVPPTAVPKP